LPKSYAKRRRLHLDALALAAVNYRQNAAAGFGFNDYDFVRIGRSTPDSAHLWDRLIVLRTFTGKARARYLANSIIAPSVPRQRTSDTERLAKSDAKFDPTNGLH